MFNGTLDDSALQGEGCLGRYIRRDRSSLCFGDMIVGFGFAVPRGRERVSLDVRVPASVASFGSGAVDMPTWIHYTCM